MASNNVRRRQTPSRISSLYIIMHVLVFVNKIMTLILRHHYVFQICKFAREMKDTKFNHIYSFVILNV